uniref:MYND-type domain-containing protein n=1 Tax=Odontella aurita TaxID=265563 RepID=A0A7S4JVQ4_9STRA|mmetsp:Transcript_5518/g.16041  ORF Transcript_5518/g.16041 Transcript_5518/m.16041 type:complete len:180 (+) Transcript_5518:148-687(+)
MFELYEERLKPESCGKVSAKLLRCSSCRAAKYCDAACQRSHWRRQKKECGALGGLMSRAESVARNDLEKRRDATAMFILGLRLGTGDEGIPRNPSLACELYEAATTVQKPIPGGHPVAMLRLALHYEVGIGVKQECERAFKYYSLAVQHPGQVGEESMCQALLALSRFHKIWSWRRGKI